MNKHISNSTIQSALSIERTILANRRTLLSYLRSAVSLIVAGAGLIEFVQNDILVTLGVICLIFAPIVLFYGIFDYIHMKKIIAAEKKVLSFVEEEGSEE